jgi:hypothetical protein
MKLYAVGLFALAAGCAENVTDGGAGTAADPTPPKIAVRLTDAPGDFEAVWVNIASVAIESADAGWQTLADQPQKLDLLQLQNDVTAALGGATLEPGAYGQLRLIVDSASVVVAGEESPLKIASGMETGVKINLDQTFEENMTYSITLDYDADKSIKTTGQGYLMTPVISVKDFVATPVEPETGSGDGSGNAEPLQ